MSNMRRRLSGIRPQRPEEPAATLHSKVLKQAGRPTAARCAVGRHRRWHRPSRPALGPATAAQRFAGRVKSRPACDHQDAVGQPAPGQPAVAPPSTCAIERDGAGRDGEPGAFTGRRPTKLTSMRSKERCADDRAPFPLHPLARGWRELTTCALHPAPDGPHGGRPGHGLNGWPSITGTPTTRTRTSSCAGATTPAKTSSSRATTSPMASAIAPPNWRPNGWDRHRAGDPADLAARGGVGAVDEPGSRPARGRATTAEADRTLQRTDCNASACC